MLEIIDYFLKGQLVFVAPFFVAILASFVYDLCSLVHL